MAHEYDQAPPVQQRTHGRSGIERQCSNGQTEVCNPGHWQAGAHATMVRECQRDALLRRCKDAQKFFLLLERGTTYGNN